MPLYNVTPPLAAGADAEAGATATAALDSEVSGRVNNSTASFDRIRSWMGRLDGGGEGDDDAAISTVAVTVVVVG